MSDSKIYYQAIQMKSICRCPACKGTFQTQAGEWPHLVTNGRAICEDCESRLVADEDVRATQGDENLMSRRSRTIPSSRYVDDAGRPWGCLDRMRREDGEDFLLDDTEALVAALGDVSRGTRHAVL